MKILIINTVPFDRNGITSVIMNFYRGLNEQISFDFIANSEILEEYYSELSKKSIIFFIKKRKSNPFNYIFFVRKVLLENSYDLVHIHGNSSLMSLELFAIGKKIPIICHVHNVVSDYPLINMILKKYFLKNYQCGISPTEEAGNFLFSGKPFHVIPNGIDLKKFSFNMKKREVIRSTLAFNDDEKVIICVGNLNKQKFQDLIIKLMPELLREMKFQLMLLGDGERKSDLEILAQTRGVGSYVHFLGSVENIEDYYSAADIFVLPTHYESFGMVVAEAEANGLPCLVSDTVPRGIMQIDDFLFLQNSDLSSWKNNIIMYSRSNKEKDLSYFDINRVKDNLLEIYKKAKDGINHGIINNSSSI